MGIKLKKILIDKSGLLLHIGIWTIYFIFWIYLFFIEFKSLEEGAVFAIFIIAIQMIIVYLNVYALIPRYLNHGRIYTYGVLLAALWGLFSIIIYLAIISFPFTDRSFLDRKQIYLLPIFMTVFSTSLPTFILILFDKLKGANHVKQLEKETVEHQLNFLKAQINPHFLFNSINSIFQLIDKDKEQSKEMLAKFSEMLRYHLYDTGTEKVSLSKEIEYLENYARMEKLRKGKNLELKMNIQPDIGYLEIVPLILLTFVENAFKHVSNHYDRPNCVEMNLTKNKNTFHIQVINTKDENSSTSHFDPYSGIGLSNVRKRLELIYPESHHLEVQEKEETFQVDLFIQLKEEYELYHSR